MDFVHQTTRAVGWAAVLLAPCATALFGWRAGVGLVSGAGWMLLNVWVIGQLIHHGMLASRQTIWSRLGWWAVKVPVLYALAACCLVAPWSSPIGFLAGFTMWFVVLWVQALRRRAA